MTFRHNLTRRCTLWYYRAIYCFISLLVSYPRASVLLPALCIFITAYPSLYRFLATTIAPYFSSFPFRVSAPQFNASTLSNRGKSSCLTQLILTCNLNLSLNSVTESNLFNYNVFTSLASLESFIASTSNGTVAITSPFPALESLSLPLKTPFIAFITFFNSKLKQSALLLFFDRLKRKDLLFIYANHLKVYLAHPQHMDVAEYARGFLTQRKSALALVLNHTVPLTTSASRILTDWQSLPDVVSPLAAKAYKLLLKAFIAGFCVIMYFSVANLSFLRSHIAIFLVWLFCVSLSLLSAGNLVIGSFEKFEWSRMHLTLTNYCLILCSMLIAAQSFLQILQTLATKQKPGLFHRRLHEMLTGLNGMPVMAKSVFRSVFTLGLVNIACILLVRFLASSDSASTFTAHLKRLAAICYVSLLLQCALYVTHLLAVIGLDLKTVDVTKALDDASDSNMNFFSAILLQVGGPLHSRPRRTSWKYKLGMYFLKIRYTDRNDYYVYLAVGFLQCVDAGVQSFIQHCASSDEAVGLMLFPQHPVLLQDTYTVFYYAEWALNVFVFVMLFFILFRFLHTRQGLAIPNSPIWLRKLSFEDEAKFFKTIELKTLAGHDQDVLTIKTNPSSSFMVSVGQDRKVLVWSPLSKSSRLKPLNIATTMLLNDKRIEFWPINHIEISSDANYIVLMNFRSGCVKCYDRVQLEYIWEICLPQYLQSGLMLRQIRILESFFRKHTIPGYFGRLSMMKERDKQSDSSPKDLKSVELSSTKQTETKSAHAQPGYDDASMLKQFKKEDFVLVLDSAEMVVFSCADGAVKITEIQKDQGQLQTHLVAARKVSTPRMSDRILCQFRDGSLVLALASNNEWIFRPFAAKFNLYNQCPPNTDSLARTTAMKASRSLQQDYEFSSLNDIQKQALRSNASHDMSEAATGDMDKFVNKPTIVAVEFVGMVVRVCNLTAQLIDLQLGIVLKSFAVGHFKPASFRVCHLEPIHCKFCGCASVLSFSVVYEDFDTNTVVLHTFKIDLVRSKSNICLRVERDPREIRCLGFSAVTEHQSWIRNVEQWVATDVNFIMGFLKCSGAADDDDEYEQDQACEYTTESCSASGLDKSVDGMNRDLSSLRRRYLRPTKSSSTTDSESTLQGFIVTAFNGKRVDYKLRETSLLPSIGLNCALKYGYKSIVVGALNHIGIYYLGNSTLIAQDIYYKGTEATISSVLGVSESEQNCGDLLGKDASLSENRMVDSQLKFINKRRRAPERSRVNNCF